jgi:hypothetical protein
MLGLDPNSGMLDDYPPFMMRRLQLCAAALLVAVSVAACGQSDTVTNRNVRAKLLDASQQTRQVYAMTREGVVTLSGSVASNDAKQLAVRLARETTGVKDVVDEIDVDAPVPTTGRR